MPITLTEEMATALDDAQCLVATVSANGMPDATTRGSVKVFDADHLAFWERDKGQMLSDLMRNPRIILSYRNPETGQSWRFYGKAEVLKDGPVRLAIMERVEQDTGYAILIRVDRVRAANDTARDAKS